MRQHKLVYTLLTYPEYGRHVRSLKGTLFLPDFDENDGLGVETGSDEELWRAMQSLTHVQCVD